MAQACHRRSMHGNPAWGGQGGHWGDDEGLGCFWVHRQGHGMEGRTSAQGLAQRHFADALRVGGKLRVQERELQRREAYRRRHAGARQCTRSRLQQHKVSIHLIASGSSTGLMLGRIASRVSFKPVSARVQFATRARIRVTNNRAV